MEKDIFSCIFRDERISQDKKRLWSFMKMDLEYIWKYPAISGKKR